MDVTAFRPRSVGHAFHLHLRYQHDYTHRSSQLGCSQGGKESDPEPGKLCRSTVDAPNGESSAYVEGLQLHETKATSKSGSSPLAAVAPTAPATHWGFSPIPFVARGRSMPGQRLIPCTQEDAAILANAQSKYPSPQEVDGGIIVRVIAAKDVCKVTSPVLRVVRNRQYGIRSGERLRLALGGALFTAVLATLGAWQLRRMEEKKHLIEYRRSHLAMQPTFISSSPFPWTLKVASNSQKCKLPVRDTPYVDSGCSAQAEAADATAGSGTNTLLEAESYALWRSQLTSDGAHSTAKHLVDHASRLDGAKTSGTSLRSDSLLAHASPEELKGAVQEWAYRPVVVHGVLDSSTELLVGPRPGLDVGNPGYCVVSPLRLHDGSVILVNKGHLPMKLAKLPPFPKAVNEEDELVALVQQKRQQLARQQFLAARHPEVQVQHMQQQQPRPHYVDTGSQQRLEQLQEVIGTRTEPIAPVTVRGVLEPGEVANSCFKALMLKNRPQEGQFLVLNPEDLAKATPGIQNRAEAGLLMVNAYSIVYDEDVLSASAEDSSVSRAANRFLSYQQKQKADYLLFYADEHTHFNYACQWFLMALCTTAMTVYKLVEVSRWRW